MDELRRVGASEVLFTNMIFEGLAFFRALVAGDLHEPSTRNVLAFQPGKPMMLTSFYQNDVLVNFAPLLHIAITEDPLHKLFGIPPGINLRDSWLARTVDSESGKTVVFQQGCVLPRDESGHDLDGNYACDSRRNVFFSRPKHYCVMHMTSEALTSPKLKEPWKSQMAHLRGRHPGISVEHVDGSRSILPKSVTQAWPLPEDIDAELGLSKQKTLLTPIPVVLKR